MADPEDTDSINWYRPDPRAVLPLDTFHVPYTLARLVRQDRFEIRYDFDFTGVIRACADRQDTWISEEIIEAYEHLFALGYAHTVECWRQGRLAGGLYGVALGGAFFGESMFHRVRDASKVALVHLKERLVSRGFTLLDTQYSTPHLEQFGVVEIPHSEYVKRLLTALDQNVRW
jgi:leucyl/phenylalanyl-tRNA--protein transferase